MFRRELRSSVAISLALHASAGVALALAGFAPAAVRPPVEQAIVVVRLQGEDEIALARRPAPPSFAPPRAAPPPVSAPPPERARPPEPVTPAPAPPPEAEPVEPEPTPPPTPAAETKAESPPIQTAAAAGAASDAASAGTPDGEAGGSVSGRQGDRDSLAGSPDVSDEQDRLARYVEAIRSKIQSRKHYPSLARRRSVEGRIVARVAIRADGRIDDIEFTGEASPLLRRATDDAIRGSAPFLAPPSGAVTIEFPIDYSLRDTS